MSKRKILVVAAHPDDEVLGCGATLALRKKQGWETHLLVLATGITGREKTAKKNTQNSSAIKKLREEMAAVKKILGFTSTAALDFPDNRMDTVSKMDLSHAIKEVIEKIRPTVIFTHHPGDYNWDHTVTFDSVLMAARTSPGESSPEEIYSFEVLSSTERSWQEGSRAFHPNIYVNVKTTIELKKQALLAYTTEYRPYPHPRSTEGIEYLARKRGSEVGLEYAEAFTLIRKVES